MTLQTPLRRLLVGNFDFEHHLAGDREKRSSQPVERVAADLATVWIGQASSEDLLWTPEPPTAEYRNELLQAGFPCPTWVSSQAELDQLGQSQSFTLTPWGWTDNILEWAVRHGLPCDPPCLDAVRAANSRRFSFDLERELGIAPEGSAECHTMKACERAPAKLAADQPWVIKAEFGMSARERILGRGPHLKPSQVNWMQHRLDLGQALFLEPWVPVIAEAGIQFDVPRESDGFPRCIGITPLLTDSSGVYRGSRFDPAAETERDWSEVVKFGQIAAKRAQTLGYHGPLGIDAMWYRDKKGEAKLRSLTDINARWTMGRLSLGFRSRLAPGECGLWRHIRCPADSPAAARRWWRDWAKSLPEGVRWLRTSPISQGGRVTRHATGLLIASDAELLASASQKPG